MPVMIEKRICPATGLELSSLGLGCWSFGGGDYWGGQDQGEVDAIVRRAVELGISFFDTAEGYNEGRSEESLGRAIRGIARDKLVIGSKISPNNCEPQTLREHCEASLRRLGTEFIDLYMVHWPINPIAIQHFTSDEVFPTPREAFETLMKLKDEGKIRHIGVSNFGKRVLDEAISYGTRLATNELPYSLLTRAIEHEILPYSKSLGLGVIAYMSLLQGIIGDRHQKILDVPAQRRRIRHFDHRKNPMIRHREEGAEAETQEALDAVRKIARENGLSTLSAAMGWVLASPGITSSIVGARNVAQLEENVASASRPLPEPIVTALNVATGHLKTKLGPGFDYWENTNDDRTV